MRRRLLILLCLAAQAAALAGCALFPSRLHGVERLLVVQAMGLDREAGALRLTMVSAADSTRGEGPVRLSGSGFSISEAVEDASVRAAEEELFCAHTGHLLLGEQSARENALDMLLRYVCRSRELRMDIPLYLVRGGSAREALLQSGDARVGAVELLDSLAASAPKREGRKPPGVSQIAGALESGGCALVAAVKLTPAAEQTENGESMTLAPAGCGVIADGALAGFLEEADMPGLDFLCGARGVHTLTLRDRDGRRVALQTAPGRTTLRALRDGEGRLTGLEIGVALDASVAEIDGRGALSDAGYVDALAANAEREILRLAGHVVQLEKTLDADFLGLSERLALVSSAGDRARDAEAGFSPAALEIRLSASVSITHSNDVRDG